MLLLNNIRSASRGAWIAGFLQTIGASASSTQIGNYLRADWGQFDNLLIVPAAGEVPTYVFATRQGVGLLGIMGATTAQIGASVVAGYFSSDPITQTNVENPYFRRVARVIIDRINRESINGPSSFHVCGHSAGGAIGAYVILDQGTWSTTLQSAYLTTFGSPRAGGRAFNSRLHAKASIIRFMNELDPVPVLPPSTSQSQWLIIGSRSELNRGLLSYVHPNGGNVLNQNGTSDEAALPDVRNVDLPASLGDWLFARDSNVAEEHGINTYQARLADIAQRLRAPVVPVDPRQEPRRVESGREIAAAVQTQIRTIFHREHTQNLTPVVIPKADLFRVVRRLSVYAVKFRGQIVMVAGTKKKARVVCRTMNAALRTMQNTAVVDTVSLLTSLNGYFEDAASAVSDFAPTMNTTIR